MSATLPPAPPVNRDVPVITSAGGSSAAYKDPNSPEAIMRKTTQTEAQSITDTRFDVPPDAFVNYSYLQGNPLFIIVACVIGLLLVLLATHRIRGAMRTVFFGAVIVLLVLSVLLKKNE